MAADAAIDVFLDVNDDLSSACQESFARLIRLMRARRGKFQFLVMDCRDEPLRERLIGELGKLLEADGIRAARIALNEADYPDFAALETALIAISATAGAIHVTGGARWFDNGRWDAFNIRREAVARSARANLLFWLDPPSITSMGRIAVDLWAWRAAVIAFASTPPALVMPEPDIRAIDARESDERLKRIGVLREALEEPDFPDEIRSDLSLELGDLLFGLGELPEAKAAFQDAARSSSDERDRALAAGRIADVLQARGELEEALRIRREEQLPVFDRLGDVRERAVTMGQIADVLQARGELEEALRIRREEELPVYDRLGDVRERAVTMGKIADVLQARGELKEALRIRREELLPVFDRLGDVRERAVTLHNIGLTILSSGRNRSEGLAEAVSALSESFTIARRLQFADGIALTGEVLGQVLMSMGLEKDGLAALDKAEAAFLKLKDRLSAQRVKRLRKKLVKRRHFAAPRSTDV